MWLQPRQLFPCNQPPANDERQIAEPEWGVELTLQPRILGSEIDIIDCAVRMAMEMREAANRLQAQWRRQGREIGFGVGVAQGYATLGQIGFSDRVDYTAIGTVCNLAARLCAEAKGGQILISRRVAAAVEDMVRLEEIGDLVLKGLMQAVAVYNVATEPRQPDITEQRGSA